MRDFSYMQADSVGAAVASHAKGNDSAYISGGTTLLDLAKLEVMRPGHVVDVRKTGYDQVEQLDDGRLRIGTNVTNTDLAYHPIVKEQYTVLSDALLSGASTSIRNKATTGGNVMQRARCAYFRDTSAPCNKREPGSGCSAIGGHARSVFAVLGTSEHCVVAHPSDMCVAMAAIGGVVNVEGPNGKRDIDFLDFHLLPGDTPHLEHALEADEMITHVSSTRRSRARSRITSNCVTERPISSPWPHPQSSWPPTAIPCVMPESPWAAWAPSPGAQRRQRNL